MKKHWNEVAARAGRNDLPLLLFYNFHTLPLEDRPKAVARSWMMPEWPEGHLPPEVWVTFFRAVGYLVDEACGDRGTLPEQLTLYRGAIPSRRLGMSWTGDRDRAEWFAHRFDGIRGDSLGKVWTVTVPRSLVLARITERREDEYVLDTTAFSKRSISPAN